MQEKIIETRPLVCEWCGKNSNLSFRVFMQTRETPIPPAPSGKMLGSVEIICTECDNQNPNPLQKVTV